MIIKQGKTNIKYLLVVFILVIIVSGGVLYYLNLPEYELTTINFPLKTENNVKDKTTECLEKYPEVEYEDCIPGEILDGWSELTLYPNTLDTSTTEYYIGVPAPNKVRQASVAQYGTSRSTCQTTWSIKIDEEWKRVNQIEFCNHILDYNYSCNDCLLEWEEDCC